MEHIKSLVHAMTELNETQLFAAIDACLQEQIEQHQMQLALQEGLKNVGQRFAKGQYYLADMMVGGDLYQEAIQRIVNQTPQLAHTASAGKVLIGVMKDDIHDIGKDVVRMLLSIEGFDVVDLGIDVAGAQFVDAVIENKPDIVALCGVMSFSADRMIETIQLLNEMPSRNTFKIIVGGSCINQEDAAEIGADGFTQEAYDVAGLCTRLLQERL